MARPKCVRAAQYLEGVCLHPEGHSIAMTSRGQAFELPVYEGPATALPHPSLGAGCRVLHVTYLSDARILTITHDAGRRSAWIHTMPQDWAAPTAALLASPVEVP